MTGHHDWDSASNSSGTFVYAPIETGSMGQEAQFLNVAPVVPTAAQPTFVAGSPSRSMAKDRLAFYDDKIPQMRLRPVR